MDRLFSTTISLIYKDERVTAKMISPVASLAEFWWDPKRPDERMLWESKIELGEKFFHEIIQHPVPLDMNILKALKRSSLGLGPLPLDGLPHLHVEESATALLAAVVPAVRGGPQHRLRTRIPSTTSARSVLRELKKIKLAWPGPELLDGQGGADLFRPRSPPSLRRSSFRSWNSMRKSLMFWAFVAFALICWTDSSGAQRDPDFERADRETVRLQPTNFVGVPEPVKATLSQLGCRIPQPWGTNEKPRNLIRGEFMEASSDRSARASMMPCLRRPPACTTSTKENGCG